MSLVLLSRLSCWIAAAPIEDAAAPVVAEATASEAPASGEGAVRESGDDVDEPIVGDDASPTVGEWWKSGIASHPFLQGENRQ